MLLACVVTVALTNVNHEIAHFPGDTACTFIVLQQLLRAMMELNEQPQHAVVCATNSRERAKSKGAQRQQLGEIN
eukprot:4816948-Amphidinium_carterae.2